MFNVICFIEGPLTFIGGAIDFEKAVYFRRYALQPSTVLSSLPFFFPFSTFLLSSFSSAYSFLFSFLSCLIFFCFFFLFFLSSSSSASHSFLVLIFFCIFYQPDQWNVEQRWYAHRELRSLLVHEIVVRNHNLGQNLSIGLTYTPSPPSADINFQPINPNSLKCASCSAAQGDYFYYSNFC